MNQRASDNRRSSTTTMLIVLACLALASTVYAVSKVNISPLPFQDNASGSAVVVEDAPSADCTVDSAGGSAHAQYCLNSGGSFGYATPEAGRFQTIHGVNSDPDISDRYDESPSNIVNTDSGDYPQNIFRFFVRERFTNVRVSAVFRIDNDNFITAAGNDRDASDGILIMARANHNGNDDMYYGGIRVDGRCVIKKKVDDVYTPGGGLNSAALSPATFPHVVASGTYDKNDISSGDASLANLLKRNAWFRLAFQAKNLTGADTGKVELKVYLSDSWSASLVEVCSAIDTPVTSTSAGTTPNALGAGYPYLGTTSLLTTTVADQGQWGIRGDFMDFVWDELRVEPAI